MGPAPIIALAAMAAAVAFLASRGGASSSAALPLPPGSAPDGELGHLANPVHTLATSASGRKYDVWMYPPIPGTGVYTVARLAGTTAWIAFMHLSGSTTNVPIKTNVMEVPGATDAERERILGQLRTDWNMPT